MKIRTVIRHIAVRVLPVLLLGAASAAAVLFAQGAYTFSFLKEDELLSVHTPSSPVGEVGEDDSGISPENGGAVGIPTPTVTRPQAARDESDILYLSARTPFTLTDVPVLQAAGFSRSTEPYTGESAVVANAGIFDFMPAVFSHYSDYRRELQYVRPTEMSEPVPVYTDVLDNVPAVQLYMGLILLDDGFFTRVYSADGVFLCEYFTGQYKCAYTRDRAGNPVFSRTVVNVQDDTSHTEYYTVEDGGMVKSDYDDALDGRGLYYDYPPAFGTPDNNLIRLAKRVVTVTDHPDGTQTEDADLIWAYGYSPTWRRTSWRYTMTRDFREGLAAVTMEDGQLFYLATSGYQAFQTSRSYYYYERYVTEYLLPPLTNGPESIGFYYYDHGLVRARRQVIDWYGITYIDTKRVAVDEDFLMDKTGAEFPIPAGYDIVAYSDGVILLEKDGRYGYMDYTGTWIAQPIYEYAQPFSEGLAVVGFGDDVRLMLDTEGNIVIPAGAYSYISNVSSGVIAGRTADGKWQILHKMARFG